MPTQPTDNDRLPSIPTDEEASRFAEEIGEPDRHAAAGDGVTQEAADAAAQPEADGTYEG